MFHVPKKYRLKTGVFKTNDGYGNNGVFTIPVPEEPTDHFIIIASDEEGWEHVSVHVQAIKRVGLKFVEESQTPLWDEMCYIKNLFWDKEDVVMQLHPAESNYVNTHPNTLHLWRPVNDIIGIIPLPPKEFV